MVTGTHCWPNSQRSRAREIARSGAKERGQRGDSIPYLTYHADASWWLSFAGEVAVAVLSVRFLGNGASAQVLARGGQQGRSVARLQGQGRAKVHRGQGEGRDCARGGGGAAQGQGAGVRGKGATALMVTAALHRSRAHRMRRRPRRARPARRRPAGGTTQGGA
jgi:hypothetical protein